MAQQAQPFNSKPSKSKKPRFSHTDNTKYGMGDYYGTGLRAKVGKMRDVTEMSNISSKKLGTPPKSLA